jgi:hypothetical protein
MEIAILFLLSFQYNTKVKFATNIKSRSFCALSNDIDNSESQFLDLVCSAFYPFLCGKADPFHNLTSKFLIATQGGSSRLHCGHTGAMINNPGFGLGSMVAVVDARRLSRPWYILSTEQNTTYM